LWIAIDNKLADLYATNIKSSYKGLSFDVIFKDNKKYHLETKLLGNANIYNILATVLLASSLGMNMEDIIRGVKNIKPIEHRLELKKYGAITIIDDAYNSNPVGSKMAVETLSLMPGKKIIVTPGMIELGSKQYELNYELGDFIAKNVDIAILVGEKQTKPIYDALIKNKFKKENLYVIDNVMEAFKIVSKIGNENTYVLLENDLPDIFNE
jgi:UDP-N-acetylmuramoyl-tripeptide--D-alanyl-D-alanine ligase